MSPVESVPIKETLRGTGPVASIGVIIFPVYPAGHSGGDSREI